MTTFEHYDRWHNMEDDTATARGATAEEEEEEEEADEEERKSCPSSDATDPDV